MKVRTDIEEGTWIEASESPVFCPNCRQDMRVRIQNGKGVCAFCETVLVEHPTMTIGSKSRPCTLDEFNEVLNEFESKEHELLDLKRAEYSNGEDRLGNFNQQALIQGMEPMDIALTFAMKHVLAIAKIVGSRKIDWSWQTTVGTEGTKQRFADARNNLILLAACIDKYIKAHEPWRVSEGTVTHDNPKESIDDMTLDTMPGEVITPMDKVEDYLLDTITILNSENKCLEETLHGYPSGISALAEGRIHNNMALIRTLTKALDDYRISGGDYF